MSELSCGPNRAVNKVVFFHNPQAASIIIGAGCELLGEARLVQICPHVIHRKSHCDFLLKHMK
ncbi:hypothetical protein EXN61_18830 [Agrobacterium tumefaciens]|uniref:Uncharacterized protein n=1 Tax=Agrobacterium tumefaciens TaxID=358 RepID=A0A546XW55_AGRTU|nr:hypothetical protein EXN61_18830 [Agrobacterium tumefaciens]